MKHIATHFISVPSKDLPPYGFVKGKSLGHLDIAESNIRTAPQTGSRISGMLRCGKHHIPKLDHLPGLSKGFHIFSTQASCSYTKISLRSCCAMARRGANWTRRAHLPSRSRFCLANFPRLGVTCSRLSQSRSLGIPELPSPFLHTMIGSTIVV